MHFEEKEWTIHSETKEGFHVSSVVPAEEEGFYLLSRACNGGKPLSGYPPAEKVTLHGKEVDFSKDAQFADGVRSKLEALVQRICKVFGDTIEWMPVAELAKTAKEKDVSVPEI